jgi:opacity protein-like surface antigen
MNKFLSLVAVGCALAFSQAYAADAAKPAASAASADKPMTKQQTKMADCNAEAKEKNLKGDERKKFMSTCLKGASDAQKAQQDKMKSCNKEAGDKKLKGDERKKFMSSCLAA